MTDIDVPVGQGLGRPTIPARAARALRNFAPAAGVLAVALLVRSLSGLCVDVSWLLTMGDKVLAGAGPYVDVIEVNPPASFLLYLPAIVIAKAAGFAPEAVVTGCLFLATAASIALTAQILKTCELRSRAGDPVLLAVVLFLLLIMPAYVFAEREHVAVIALLPMLAAYVARARHAKLGVAIALMAGIGGGLAIAIKPYFALALVLPLPYVAVGSGGRIKAWTGAAFNLETCAAAAVALGYAAITFIFFPAFVTDTLPLVVAVYLPVKITLLALLANPSLLLFLGLAVIAVVVDRKGLVEPVTAVLMLAACGFTVAFAIQAKGWPYHGYPAATLAALACARRLIDRLVVAGPTEAARGRDKTRLGAAVAALLALVGAATYWFGFNDEVPAITEAVARLAPPHASIVAIGGNPTLGHPLTRNLHGRWVSRFNIQWITADISMLQDDPNLDAAGRKALESYSVYARHVLVEDIARNRPDVVLVQDDAWREWIAVHADLDAALAQYREAARISGVSLLLRKGDPAS